MTDTLTTPVQTEEVSTETTASESGKRRGRRTAKETIAASMGTTSDRKVFELVGKTVEGATDAKSAAEKLNDQFKLSLCLPSVRNLLREGLEFANSCSRIPAGWGATSSARMVATRGRGRAKTVSE